MLRCVAIACLFPLLFTLCSPRTDPNLNRDKRGEAIKLVQESPGPDKTHKVIDFTSQALGMMRASGTPVVDYGWSAELVSGSSQIYTVRFSYKERDIMKEALWTADIVTKEVKIKNTEARKYTWS
ncbi:MAG TPA: hypothetical protein VFC63_04300 [Blastocatellia bacterium]|nr:hypothetical protein [Blastocatellia bacterium]